MEVLEARVRTGISTYYPHRLEILVDYIPKTEDIVYRAKKDGPGTAYLAEAGGYVTFMWHSPSNETGFGGSTFNIELDTGEKLAVKGPWSSRAYVMESLFGVQAVPCSITDTPSNWDKGYTFYAGHITYELAKQTLDTVLRDWELARAASYGEHPWEIVQFSCPLVEDKLILCTEQRHSPRKEV